MRGFDYHEIGEVNGNGNVIGGKYLAIASGEYEYYFNKDWGVGVFVDAGDAFSTRFSVNVGAGVGLRWHSPLGPVRVDIAFPVESELPDTNSWRLRVTGAGHMRRLVKWSAVSLTVLLLLVGGFASWLLFTTSGARWVTGTVTAPLAPKIYRGIDGTIAGKITITDFRFEGGADSIRIRIQSMRVDPTLMMLFSRALRVDHARVQGLTVVLPPAKDEPGPDKPLWIEPPLDVTVKDFQLADATIYRQNEKLVTIRQVGLSARWRAQNSSLNRLPRTLATSGRSGGVGRDHSEGARCARAEGALEGRGRAGDPRVACSRAVAKSFQGTPKAYAVKGALDVGPNELCVVIDASGPMRAPLRHSSCGRVRAAGAERTSNTSPWRGPCMPRRAISIRRAAHRLEWASEHRCSFARRARGGPRGVLQIATLSGELRGRPIAGEGNVELAAPSTLVGDLRVSSGKSRIS